MSRTKQQGYSDKTEKGQQQVQEQKAGRELDALVAEKLFGAVEVQEGTILRGWHKERDIMGRFGERYKVVPRYSTDIAAAWEVVERLGQMGPQIVVNHFCSGLVGTWAYHVTCHTEDMRHYAVESDSVPLAICLAALKAVGA